MTSNVLTTAVYYLKDYLKCGKHVSHTFSWSTTEGKVTENGMEKGILVYVCFKLENGGISGYFPMLKHIDISSTWK